MRGGNTVKSFGLVGYSLSLQNKMHQIQWTLNVYSPKHRHFQCICAIFETWCGEELLLVVGIITASSLTCLLLILEPVNILYYQVIKVANKLILCLVTSVMSDSLGLYGLQPARFLCPWDSPGKNTGVDCHALQGIFPTQGSNPSLLHCR